MGVVFTTEPMCLNSTQLQVRLYAEGVRVNVTIQFSWVITSLQSDKEAVWWVGIRRDHICSPPPIWFCSFTSVSKVKCCRGHILLSAIKHCFNTKCQQWPQGFAVNYQLIADILNLRSALFVHLMVCVHSALCKCCSSRNKQPELLFYLLPDAHCSPESH